MVNISNAISKGATLISSTVNEKTGTTVKKLVSNDCGKFLATVVEYGENTPLKKKGIDTFIKLGKGNPRYTKIDKVLLSGDKVVLSGASKAKNFAAAGDFNARFKEMVDLFKKYPKLNAELIPQTSSKCDFQTMTNLLKQIL